jgi:hypothetical protein
MVVWTGAGIHERLGEGLAMIVSAAGIWFAGKALNDPAKARILIDPQSGQQVRVQKTHTLFWIKMEWWAIVVVIWGIYIIVTKKP